MIVMVIVIMIVMTMIAIVMMIIIIIVMIILTIMMVEVLSNLQFNFHHKLPLESLSAKPGLNRRPSELQFDALPTELLAGLIEYECKNMI